MGVKVMELWTVKQGCLWEYNCGGACPVVQWRTRLRNAWDCGGQERVWIQVYMAVILEDCGGLGQGCGGLALLRSWEYNARFFTDI